MNFTDIYSVDQIEKANKVLATYHSGYTPIALSASELIERNDNLVVSLRLYYAKQVFDMAMRIATKTDNPLRQLWNLTWINRSDSFMKLTYINEVSPMLVDDLLNLMKRLADSGVVKVNEKVSYECDMSIDSNLYLTPKAYTLFVVDAVDAAQAKQKLENAEFEPLKSTPRSYSWSEIENLYCTLSLEEIELVNGRWINCSNEIDKMLFSACFLLDYRNIIKVLHIGANINAIDEEGRTPIYHALRKLSFLRDLANSCGLDKRAAASKSVIRQTERIIKMLLRHGADPNLFGYDGQSPLTLAQKTGCDEIEKLLIENGAEK